MTQCDNNNYWSNKFSLHKLTFPSHPSLQTFLEPAVLTLVPVVLVNGAVSAAPARVGEIPSDWPLEETLASLAGELTVVLPWTLVTAHDAFDAGLLRWLRLLFDIVGIWRRWRRRGTRAGGVCGYPGCRGGAVVASRQSILGVMGHGRCATGGRGWTSAEEAQTSQKSVIVSSTSTPNQGVRR